MKTNCAVILFGPPGSGKTTVVRALTNHRRLAVIETGNLLEQAVRLGTDLGRQIDSYKAAGNLVPTSIVKDVVLEGLNRVRGESVLFDGFPRHSEQVEVFFQLLQAHPLELCAVLVLTLDLEIAIQRLAGRRLCPQCGALYNLHTSPPRAAGQCDQCGTGLTQRKDDRPEIVRHRFDTYRRETVPVIEYFQREYPKLCVEVPAAAPLSEIETRVCERLDQILGQRGNAAAPPVKPAEPG